MTTPQTPIGSIPSSSPGPGLWVARSNPHPFATILGFQFHPEERQLFPESLIGVWVCASDYLELTSDGVAERDGGEALLERLMVWHARLDLLMGLAALNHIAADSTITDQWVEEYRKLLPEGARNRLDSTLASRVDGPRVFLTRPTILRTMRLVAERAPATEAERAERVQALGVVDPPLDLLFTVTLMSHLVAQFLGLDDPGQQQGPDDRFSGLPTGLALEMVCSGMSTRAENPGNLLGRTRMLYVEYGRRVRRNPARLPALGLVEDALEMPLDVALALGFAYYAQMVGYDWRTDGVRFQSPLGLLDIPEQSWLRFLDLFAQTVDEFASSAARMTKDWQMRSIQERPLLRIGNEVVVLDERFLIERVTSGLYWLVHDHEKALDDRFRHLWTQAYGEMHEMLVEDYLAPFAPPVLGGLGTSLFTEEDLGAAFGGKRADVGIDFGTTVLIADAQAGQLSTKTREEGDPTAFKRDLDQIVVNKKARQLHYTAACLMRDPQPPKSPLAQPARRVVPVVVPGGTFPTSPITRRYIAGQLADKGLLNEPGVDPLVVLDLRDLEHAEAVRAYRGIDLVTMIRDWQDSDYRDMSLSDWLIVAFDDPGLDRPGILRVALERSFDVIRERATDKESVPESAADEPKS